MQTETLAHRVTEFVPIAGGCTYVVRGSVHQVMIVGDDALNEYLERECLERGHFVHDGGNSYPRASIYRDDGSACAELHRIQH